MLRFIYNFEEIEGLAISFGLKKIIFFDGNNPLQVFKNIKFLFFRSRLRLFIQGLLIFIGWYFMGFFDLLVKFVVELDKTGFHFLDFIGDSSEMFVLLQDG